jgi:hypothetical protein
MRKTNFSLAQRLIIRGRQTAYKSKTSSPYISSDGIAENCGLVIQTEHELQEFSRLRSIPNIVYCKSSLVSHLNNSLISPTEKRILVAGNCDYEFHSKVMLPSNIFHNFYLQNSFISDNKNIFTLPIGIENLSIGINGLKKNFRYTKNWNQKLKKVLVGPFSPTHQGRQIILKSANDRPDLFDVYFDFIRPDKFAKLMSEYQYVLCPRGNGEDTHRFWETLYRGAVPIVLKNVWSQSLDYLGFPFIQVSAWEQVQIEVDKFEKNFFGFNPKSISPLWLDHWENSWKDLIKE